MISLNILKTLVITLVLLIATVVLLSILLKISFLSGVTLVLSMVAIIFTILSFVHRTSPSLTARMDTKLVPNAGSSTAILEGGPTITTPSHLNYGGQDPLFPGEQYLDLIVFNGGPGTATDVTWKLSVNGYMSGQYLKGIITVLEPRAGVNVQGYLKIYHENRKTITKQYRKDQRISPVAVLRNEQVKEILDRTKKVEKYGVTLCYRSFLGVRRTINISFNETGEYIGTENC